MNDLPPTASRVAPGTPDGATAGGPEKVQQLHTGNLYLWVLDGDRKCWSVKRTSVRLEPSLWEMLYEIAERERRTIHELGRMVQVRSDRRLTAALAARGGALSDEGDEAPDVAGPVPEDEEGRSINVSSALRAFVAAYFWKLAMLVEAEVAPPPTPGGRIEAALGHVSPEYLSTAKTRLATRRAGHVRRGRPPKKAV
ncbi:MAG TPA: ribbon-helix-helix domain-containing protein [Azospirillaceae bacterium]|nr:ribbon-helix-helix domain-containing protein [Azospirillaceae bacterium]